MSLSNTWASLWTPPPLTPRTDERLWKPKLTVTLFSKPQLGKDPWSNWRLHITASPGLQTMGTAPLSLSLPDSATSFLMSIFPTLCVPGITQTPFTAVLPYAWTIKLKPWISSSKSSLSQWVTPSWCQDTAAPTPGSFINKASLKGAKSSPLIASATFKSSGCA